MSKAYQIVVCGGLAPDPLQTLEPLQGTGGWGLKNEMMLPGTLDPWAACALFEAAALAKKMEGSKVYLVTLAPRAKIQQVMMTMAQKVPFELVALDSPVNGFSDARQTADALAAAIEKIPGLDKSSLLLFGGWESATRGAGAVMQMVGEKLGILNQFYGVDKLTVGDDGCLTILERIEGGKHLESCCSTAPVVCGWATGSLPEPPNNPQVGMVNMRTIMPSLQKAQPAAVTTGSAEYASVELPRQMRQTRVEKDMNADDIAREIVEWIKN